MAFGNKILKYKDDILKDLANVVAIDSVSADGCEKPQKALEYMLNRGKEMGLVTKNVDNIAGHIEYGSGTKLCGVLTHLDVVPAGEGWSVPAFALTRKDGRIYGRGVADDKGSAVIAMYCLKALKDNNITANSTIRLILGTNEETGMTDVQHYFSKETLPEISFTPDSDYGICQCEKGILQFTITGKNNSEILISAIGGGAVNAVPDRTEFSINTNLKISENSNGSFSVINNGTETTVISKGIASHAMEPQNGFNSITHAISMLCSVFGEKQLGNLPDFINKYIGTTTDGSLLGINQSDKQSGCLTLNVGTININKNSATAKIDIRYPVSANYENIVNTITNAATGMNLEMHIDSHLSPLNVPENSKVISILQQAYSAITGQMPNLYSTGGGTYARSLGNKGVAFGPVFANDYSNMHKPDESLNEENFFLHAQICLEAMYKMFMEQ